MYETIDIYLSLRNRIINHEFEPGQKLNQRMIAEQYGVSNTPVIKALHRLTSEGLVDNIVNRGFVVHSTNLKELVDLYELREALEVTAVADLATLSREETQQIAEEIDALMREGGTGNTEKYRQADIALHNTILNRCSNEMLRNINEAHQILNRTYLPGLLRDTKETWEEHRAIAEAIGNRDQEAAREAMRKHISITKQSIASLVGKLTALGLNPRNILVDDLVNKELNTEGILDKG